MFGIGFTEIIVVVLAALLIFGPEKLPELAKHAGKIINDLRRVRNDLHSNFHDAMYAQETKKTNKLPYLMQDETEQKNITSPNKTTKQNADE